MMEVVVSTGTKRRTKDPVESSPPTNQHPTLGYSEHRLRKAIAADHCYSIIIISWHAPVRSSPPTNQHPQLFYRLDTLPVARPTVSEHWR